MPFIISGKIVNARPGPARALLVRFTAKWTGHWKTAWLLDIRGVLKLGNRVLSTDLQVEQIFSGGMVMMMKDGEELNGTLSVGITPEALRYVEQHRGKAPVPLTLELKYKWQEVFQHRPAQQTPAGTTEAVLFGGRVMWEDASNILEPVPQSEWAGRILGELEWADIELFEIHLRPMLDDENLRVAKERLDDARLALRNHDDRKTLAMCYAAFESAAKHEAKGGDKVKQGFDLLLERAFASGHEPKRKEVNALIKALREFLHFGRHEGYPAIDVSHDEAEFCFATTIAFFSMLTRRLQ